MDINDKAIFVGKDGKEWDVIIKSEPMFHCDAPAGVIARELLFIDSPEGPGMFSVNDSQIKPKG